MIDAMVSTPRAARKDVVRNRALLLESADAMIREHGMELSLNAVAHHAGVGVGTVYRHFPDRETLIEALFRQRIDGVSAILSEHVDDEDPVQGLRTAIFEICQMQSEDRGVWEVLSSGRRDTQREIVQARLVPLAARLVTRANATGRLRTPFQTNDLPILLWTGGALTSYLAVASDTAWRRYVHMMFDSFLSDDDPARQVPDTEPLTDAQVDMAMQAWRPPTARRG